MDVLRQIVTLLFAALLLDHYLAPWLHRLFV